jgi:hypothetical protein
VAVVDPAVVEHRLALVAVALEFTELEQTVLVAQRYSWAAPADRAARQELTLLLVQLLLVVLAVATEAVVVVLTTTTVMKLLEQEGLEQFVSYGAQAGRSQTH